LATGGTRVIPKKKAPETEDKWLSNKAWCTIEEVSESIMLFSGFDDEFVKNLDEWEKLSHHP